MDKLTRFLMLVPSSNWSKAPLVWNDQLRQALSDDLVRVGFGGKIELTSAGRLRSGFRTIVSRNHSNETWGLAMTEDWSRGLIKKYGDIERGRKKAPEGFHDQLIEPTAICRNCEYFDGGGLGRDGVPINFEGDCHNSSSSQRFTTNQDQTCKGFWPCSTRWPDCDHD